MRERPILMSAPMVRAILADTKSQTRRVVKDAAWRDFGDCDIDGKLVSSWDIDRDRCPYGRKGDRLWVRETWTWIGGSTSYPQEKPAEPGAYDKLYVRYAADGAERTVETGGKALPVPKQPPRREGEEYSLRDAPAEFVYTGDNTYMDRLDRWWKRKIPGIHMPRWASRITLEVTDMRVERLKAISEADAIAEGVECDSEPCDHARRSCEDVGCMGPTHRAGYAQLWDSLNGASSWDANPWVWVVSFRRIEA